MTVNPRHTANSSPPDTMASRNGWDRDRIRREITLTCEVRMDNGTWTKVDLVNLTNCGFQIAWLPRCRAGAKVLVRMPGLQALSATVRWQNNFGIGCEFAAPLYEPVFEHLVRLADAN